MTAALRQTFADFAQALGVLSPSPVHVCSRRHFRDPISGQPTRLYQVLVDGEIYVAREHELQALENGVSPAELELTPEEEWRP